MSGLLVGGFMMASVGIDFTEHQAARQLRQPPLFGDWATRNTRKIHNLLLFLSGIGLPACLWYAVGFRLGLLALPGSFFAVRAVVNPLIDAQEAASARASLRAKAGWLRLQLGDAESAAERLGEAQAELLDAVGPGNALTSWVAAAGPVRALCEAGRAEEAAGVRAAVEAAASKNASEWKWKKHGPLLRAGVAAAIRAPEAEILGLLEAAATAKCWVPAGSRPVHLTRANDNGSAETEGGLPEWDEFLWRMASTDAVEAGGGMVAADDRQRWEAYRDTTVGLARTHLAQVVRLGDSGGSLALEEALELRSLPKKAAKDEDLAARHERLLASFFAHRAYAFDTAQMRRELAEKDQLIVQLRRRIAELEGNGAEKE